MKNNYKKIHEEIKQFVDEYNKKYPENSFLDVSEAVEDYIEKNHPDLSVPYAGCGFGVRDLEVYKKDRFVMEIDIDCKTKQVIDR